MWINHWNRSKVTCAYTCPVDSGKPGKHESKTRLSRKKAQFLKWSPLKPETNAIHSSIVNCNRDKVRFMNFDLIQTEMEFLLSSNALSRLVRSWELYVFWWRQCGNIYSKGARTWLMAWMEVRKGLNDTFSSFETIKAEHSICCYCALWCRSSQATRCHSSFSSYAREPRCV